MDKASINAQIAEAFGWKRQVGTRGHVWYHSPACKGTGTIENLWDGCDVQTHAKLPPDFCASPDASKRLRAKLAEKYDWLLGSGKVRAKEPQFGFALYTKGSRGAREVATAEADTEEMAVALCALNKCAEMGTREK